MSFTSNFFNFFHTTLEIIATFENAQVLLILYETLSAAKDHSVWFLIANPKTFGINYKNTSEVKSEITQFYY